MEEWTSGYLNKFMMRATSVVHRVGPGERIFTGIFTIPDAHRTTCVTRVQPCLGAQSHASYVLLFSRSVVSDSFATSWDCSLPGSSVHGISQVRMLEWAAISFSRGYSPSRDWTHVSCIDRQEPPVSHLGNPAHSTCTHCQLVRDHRHVCLATPTSPQTNIPCINSLIIALHPMLP